MKLRKHSWHYLLYNATYQSYVPSNLCPYFWKLLFAIVSFPVNFIMTLPVFIVDKIIKIWDKDGFELNDEVYFSIKYLCAIILYLAGFIAFCMLSMWFFPFMAKHGNKSEISNIWLAGFIGWGVVIFFLLRAFAFYVYGKLSSGKKVYKEKSPNILSEFVKAKYKKYCPRIDWQ